MLRACVCMTFFSTIVFGFLLAFANADLLPVTQLQNVGSARTVSFPAWLTVGCEKARRRVLTQRADFISAASVTKVWAVGHHESRTGIGPNLIITVFIKKMILNNDAFV